MNEITNQDAKTILEAGAALGNVRIEEGVMPFVVVPREYHVVDLEHLMPEPTRKRAAVTMLDADSFIAYVKEHAIEDCSCIYADVDFEAGKYSLLAVIDDHGTDQPMWRAHTASLAPLQSLEWKRWRGHDRKAMPQADFAAFIEDNLGDIATVPEMPTGKDMLEMALAFEANSDKRFKRKLDLQGGGTHLEYVDQADDATSTKMRYFERFAIGIPVFQGATNGYFVEARLKFRMAGGALTFWFELIRPDRVFKTAVSSEVEKIREATNIPVLFGRPGLSR